MRSCFSGDLSIKDGKVKVGRTLANKPNFLRIRNSPCSGRTLAEDHCQTAVNQWHQTKRHLLSQMAWVSSGYGSPTASMAAAPLGRSS